MAKEGLGTKRVCPETGKKFYDLGKDPIVSPYSGKEYPLSFFEETPADKVVKEPVPESKPEKKAEAETESEEETEAEGGPEIVSLEDADAEAGAGDDSDDDDDEDGDGIPDIPDVDIEDDEEEDGDAFLEDEESDDDLSDVITGVDDEEET